MIDVRWALERENDWRDVMRDLSRSADAVAEPAEKPARGWPFGLTGWRMYLNRTVEGYFQASKNNYEAGASRKMDCYKVELFRYPQACSYFFPTTKASPELANEFVITRVLDRCKRYETQTSSCPK